MTDLQNGLANDFLKEKLRENILSVVFVKKDGTERKMRCTLREDLIPTLQETATTAQNRVRSDESLAVWDLEKDGWRSFRYDSIIGFSETN
jgi:hypothetical protein